MELREVRLEKEVSLGTSWNWGIQDTHNPLVLWDFPSFPLSPIFLFIPSFEGSDWRAILFLFPPPPPFFFFTFYFETILNSQDGFLGSSAGKESSCSAGDLGLIPGLGRSPGKENSNPLQYSGLENSMGCIQLYRTWGSKSLTQLSNFHLNS